MTLYVTTPIYYVNDAPHIGHAYTTVIADVLARYHRLFGEEVFFLTGTDEHGQKVQQAAKSRGVDPQAHCDEYMQRFQAAWRDLDVKPDIFMRTTYPFHREVVQSVLIALHEKGDIYSKEYEGWYSVSEEIFYTEKDLVDGKSPFGKEVQKVTEKNYFFRMSKYQQALIDHINKNPQFIVPEGKRNEVLGFLRQPLEDLCISRPKARLSWGIEVPFDKEYVTYVWFDALLNYLSAIGYAQGEEKERRCAQFWPHVRHLMGKDILTTHAVYWTTMLFAMGVPLPKQIVAHGWWLNSDGSKMSKSGGAVVSPLDMRTLVGTDPLRYFLCREIVFGNDGAFSSEMVVARVNAELANNLGNLFSRTVNLMIKYYDSRVPGRTAAHPATVELRASASAVAPKVKAAVETLQLQQAIGEVVDLLSATNRYLELIAPWKSAKEDPALAGEALYSALDIVRIAALLLSPVMPTKCAELLHQIGWTRPPAWSDAGQVALLEPGTPLTKPAPLFPRAEKTRTEKN